MSENKPFLGLFGPLWTSLDTRNGRKACNRNLINTCIGRKEEKKKDVNPLEEKSSIDEAKVKVGFYLDKLLLANFRSLIQKKYHKYERGLFSYEAEMALRHWLSLHTNAQTTLDPNKPNPTPKVSLIFAQVKNRLLTQWYYELRPGQQISVTHLEKAIMAVRGSDPRTVRKWKRAFHQMGLVKPITSSTWEIL